MKTLQKWYFYYFAKPEIKLLFQLFFIIALVFWANHAFAEEGGDILAGTDATLGKTISGTGKKIIYMIEGVIAISLYMKTRNLLVFTGVVAVALFLNVLFKISGIG